MNGHAEEMGFSSLSYEYQKESSTLNLTRVSLKGPTKGVSKQGKIYLGDKFLGYGLDMQGHCGSGSYCGFYLYTSWAFVKWNWTNISL